MVLPGMIWLLVFCYLPMYGCQIAFHNYRITDDALGVGGALLLNEIRNLKFKRVVQTLSYLPHFLSWVILGGIMITWLSDTGVINRVLIAMGVLDEGVSFLAKPQYFWGISVISDLEGTGMGRNYLSGGNFRNRSVSL